MKCSNRVAVAVLVILLALSVNVSSRHITKPRHDEHTQIISPKLTKMNITKADQKPQLTVVKRAAIRPRRGPDTLQVAGSSLPDCSHACGSCRPCRLVMVSFVCASLAEAETCPMAYKCMCKRKSYPVP